MCGIAGIVAFDGRPVCASDIRAMTDRMKQRGPDDEGSFTAGPVGLGMRRLSIIDVEGGHQPLSNEAGDIHLVFNGEIYNHVELRQQLIERGHAPRTASDGEVIVHLYEEKGPACLADLNGMFAIALYDARTKTVWLARDRLGIKPLFYSVTERSLAFASDINALRAAHPTDIDPGQVVKYMGLSYVPDTQTIWKGVRKLPPAHFATVTGSRLTVQKYWSVSGIGQARISADEATEQLEFLLRDALRLQLRSDVPLGVFLSGGVDSSALVAMAAGQLAEPLRTFTIQFDDKGSLDGEFAGQVARQYATRHTVLPMGPADAITALDELLPMMDEPLSDSALLPAYLLSKAARAEGIKVLLNGAGGDEIFGGYSRHRPARMGTPTWVAETVPSPFRQLVAGGWSAFQPDRAARASDAGFAWAAGVSGVNLPAARSILRNPRDYESMTEAIREEFTGLDASQAGLGYSHARMELDLRTYLPQDVLALTDKATMAASVEGRVPLIDHRLVEFAFSLPISVNLLEDAPKGLFKRVLRDRLPAALLNRRKEGFNPPDAAWLRNDGRMSLADELLGAATPMLNDLFDRTALESLINNPAQRRRSASMLFALFIFNRWQRSQPTHSSSLA
jgi:asparagine synthase (glutamine-hydrolysing)